MARRVRRLAKRFEGFFGRYTSGLAVALTLLAIPALAWFWEGFRTLLTSVLSPLVAPISMPALGLVILPLLGAVVLYAGQRLRDGLRKLRRTVHVGGWVDVMQVAFRISEAPPMSGDRFWVDGPFCAACRVRLTEMERGYSIVYVCLTKDCPNWNKSSIRDDVRVLARRAEATIEAACVDAEGRGFRPTIDPRAPLVGESP
jgi:hypothetical protein